MNVPTTLGAYALGLGAVFGVTAAVGSAVGPIGSTATAGHAAHDDSKEQTVDHSQHAGAAAGREERPGGLLISEHGYTLDVPRQLPAGDATALSFRVLGRDGRPVTAYDEAHDKDLHLIAVRRDLSGFQHVHPELAADGTWSVPLRLTAGTWRVFADFDPAGDDPALVLGADLVVAGEDQPQPLPRPTRTAQVDAYTVALDGDLVAGQESVLTLSVARDGRPVTDLQPYLGAYGHLVALRDGDLAYLHVHPAGAPGDGTTRPGPSVTFHASAPAGTYRLFLDFKHGDVVRTAALTVQTGGTTAPAPTSSPSAHGDDGHAH